MNQFSRNSTFKNIFQDKIRLKWAWQESSCEAKHNENSCEQKHYGIPAAPDVLVFSGRFCMELKDSFLASGELQPHPP